MHPDEARAIASTVSHAVNPAAAGVSLTVDGGEAARYCIWTVEDGQIHQHILEAALTSPERLEAHLRGFVQTWAEHRGIYIEADQPNTRRDRA